MKQFKKIIDLVSSNPNIDVLILDAYGVYWSSKDFFPNAIATFKELKRKEKIVCVLSNTTKDSESVEKGYEEKGLIKNRDYDFVLTSGDFSKEIITKNQFDFKIENKKYYVLWKSNDFLFKDSGLTKVSNLQEADFVYIGVPVLKDKDDKLEVNSLHVEPFLSELEKIIKFKKPMICANPDYRAHEDEGFVVRQGLIAKCYEELGGKVQYFGKPYQGIYNHLKAKLNREYGITDFHRCLMVGDTVRTDIKGGKDANMQTALIVQTGVTAEEVLENGVVNDQKIFELLMKENTQSLDFICDKFS